ncbi:hypothetical protein [Gordonibacter pamelaeae]|uniref:hypothetical protein n=1 Tax=Gordonibacter pamelaeae TaxID=471189 RepID=UPI003A8EEE93
MTVNVPAFSRSPRQIIERLASRNASRGRVARTVRPTSEFCCELKISSRKLRSNLVTGSLTTFSMVVPCEAHSLSKMLSGMSAGRVNGL